MALSLRYLIRCALRLLGLVLVGLWLAPWLALGAVLSDRPDAPQKEVSLRFTVFGLSAVEGLVYRAAPDGPPRALQFHSAYRSARYDYRGGERLCFYDGSAVVADPHAAPVATYAVPEGVADLLLLFLPRRAPTTDGLLYDVYGVDDGLGRAPAGHFTTINVSGREYVAHHSGESITIPRGVGAVHAARGRVSLALAAQVGEAWLATGKHEFNLAARDRVTLIFFPSASGTSVYPIIRRLVDSVPREPAKRQDVAQDESSRGSANDDTGG